MIRSFISLVAVALAVTGCTPTDTVVQASPYSLAETKTPVQYFSSSCLNSLPNFTDFDAVAAELGLVLKHEKRGNKLYTAPTAKPLAVGFSQRGSGSDRTAACGVFFLGPDDTDAVGKLFLAEATKRTGGKPKTKYPSDFFQYAYHLRNGSMLTYDVRFKNGVARHIFLISPPISEDKVAEYIYN